MRLPRHHAASTDRPSKVRVGALATVLVPLTLVATAIPATATVTASVAAAVPADGGLTITVVNKNPAYSDAQTFVSATGNGTGAAQLPLSQRSTFKVDSLSSGRVVGPSSATWVPGVTP